MAKYPGFVGPSYVSPSKIASDDQCINWYPAKIESGTGTAEWVFNPAPGYRWLKLTGQPGPCRGLLHTNGYTFAVFGSSVIRLAQTVSGTEEVLMVGISNTNDSLVSMATNGDGGQQLMVASDSTLYCINDIYASTTFSGQIITTIQAQSVVFQDAYFIALDAQTSSIYLSALEDGTSWDPLDVAQRNDSPDKWIDLLVRPKELWLFGNESTSVYYNNGGDDGFPYVPNPSVAIPYGTAAPDSPALLAGSPIWLSNDLTVRYASGYTAQRVSTHAIEYAIEQMETVNDAEGFSYSDQGHDFYVLNFPTEGQSWVYDRTSGLWHQRGSWNGLTFGVGYARCCVFAYGLNLVGLRTDALLPTNASRSLYEYTQNVAIEPNVDGATDDVGLRRVRRAPHLTQELKDTGYDRFQLYMEVGLGLTTGQGSDPLVYLRWSNDGGQSFGNLHSASAGRIGQYRTRVEWRSLGAARDRVFEVSCSDQIPWRLIDAFLDVRVGAS